MMLALGVAAVMSCSKDDENNDQASIIGTWKESKTVVYNGSNNAVLATELPDDCDKKNTYDFTDSGKLHTKTFYTKSDGTCADDGNFTYSYSYDAGAKKIIVDGESSDVLALTSSELQIVVDMNDENGDGVDDKVVLVLYR